MELLRTCVREKRRLFNVRLTESEREAIQKKAEKWARGNVSEFVRYAAVNFEPGEQDLAKKKSE